MSEARPKLHERLKARLQVKRSLAQPICAVAGAQLPPFGQVASVTVIPLPEMVGESRRGALQKAESDPIADAEREAIQAVWDPANYHQTIPQPEMVAGLLAGAGNPRWGAQVESQIEADASARPLFCFPCGVQVPDGRRQWSDARGWCCATCFRGAA